MLPDVVCVEFVGKHLLYLIGQRVRRAENYVGILLLHILGVGGQKFLAAAVSVDVGSARKLYETSHIAAVGGHDIGTGESHEHKNLGTFLVPVFVLVFLHKAVEFFKHGRGLLLSAEFFAQSFD